MRLRVCLRKSKEDKKDAEFMTFKSDTFQCAIDF